MSNEGAIRDLVERWAIAVHAGDLDGVLADHADDIVMFDVPPPEMGFAASTPTARPGRLSSNGKPRAPRSRSPPSTSPLVSDVAFAYALLRCGTAEELEKDPDNRLRLTIGLRKEDGRWVVAHEHHSFPDKAASA